MLDVNDHVLNGILGHKLLIKASDLDLVQLSNSAWDGKEQAN